MENVGNSAHLYHTKSPARYMMSDESADCWTIALFLLSPGVVVVVVVVEVVTDCVTLVSRLVVVVLVVVVVVVVVLLKLRSKIEDCRIVLGG